jgi:hypothetical protein
LENGPSTLLLQIKALGSHHTGKREKDKLLWTTIEKGGDASGELEQILGLATELPSTGADEHGLFHLTSKTGSPRYMAPEVNALDAIPSLFDY